MWNKELVCLILEPTYLFSSVLKASQRTSWHKVDKSVEGHEAICKFGSGI